MLLIREFTPEWYTWLGLTGIFMACAWGSKVNGILTVIAVGIAVLIDLWDVLDYKKEGHTMVTDNSLLRVKTHCYPRTIFGGTSSLAPSDLLPYLF
jgi:dolichyl-phosphate-mannose--protein O-mannosyl transferase